MKKGIRKERQKLVMALAINGSDELKTWGKSCVRTFRRLVREPAPQEEIVGVCLRSGEFYVAGRRPDGAFLERRWCFTGREIDPYVRLYKGPESTSYFGRRENTPYYVLRPVGITGCKWMRLTLQGMRCGLPPEGISKKAVIELRKCGLLIRVDGMGIAAVLISAE